MNSLREAFNNPQRVQAVVMHVTLTDAASLKLLGDANWLPTMAWFFDQVGDAVAAQGGTVCKYLNDGIVATFPIDLAAEAINSAIQVQERIVDAQRDNTYRCNCAIGIATGRVVEFSNGVYTDYIGTVVDCSARLAEAANAGAIFVDEATVGASNMMRVFSNYGNVINREGGQYLSSIEELPAAGFPTRIPYHEILWAAQPFSVRASEVTKIPDVSRQPRDSEPQRRPEWVRGTVKRWFADRDSGLVTTGAGATHYLHARHLCAGLTRLDAGATVFFRSEPPTVEGRYPKAVCALPLGIELPVTVDRIFPAYGFHLLTDAAGKSQDLFLVLGHGAPDRHERGQQVRVRVGESPRGPVGMVIPSALDAIPA